MRTTIRSTGPAYRLSALELGAASGASPRRQRRGPSRPSERARTRGREPRRRGEPQPDRDEELEPGRETDRRADPVPTSANRPGPAEPADAAASSPSSRPPKTPPNTAVPISHGHRRPSSCRTSAGRTAAPARKPATIGHEQAQVAERQVARRHRAEDGDRGHGPERGAERGHVRPGADREPRADEPGRRPDHEVGHEGELTRGERDPADDLGVQRLVEPDELGESADDEHGDHRGAHDHRDRDRRGSGPQRGEDRRAGARSASATHRAEARRAGLVPAVALRAQHPEQDAEHEDERRAGASPARATGAPPGRAR